MTALIRIGRRRAVGDGESFEEFFRVEFRERDGTMSLRPSVYRTDGSQGELIRSHGEHAASCLTLPPRGGAHFDVAGLADHRVAECVGSGRFLFTRLRHAEVRFDTETLALEFVRDLHRQLASRGRATTRAELRAYVRACIAAHDLEWHGFVNDPKTSREWRRECAVGNDRQGPS